MKTRSVNEPFELAREPAARCRVEHFESCRTEQQVLFTGLDCLPGQQDLFDDIDSKQAEAQP